MVCMRWDCTVDSLAELSRVHMHTATPMCFPIQVHTLDVGEMAWALPDISGIAPVCGNRHASVLLEDKVRGTLTTTPLS